jgi:uncharacterized protein (TIGR00369 family)
MESHPLAGFNELLGIQLKGADGAGYRLELEIDQRHLNGAGGVHGGVYLSLLDTAMARACRLGQAEAAYWPTLEMKVNFLRSVGAGRIVANGYVIKRGRRTCYVEGELLGDGGQLLARGSGTMMAVER